MIRKSIHEGVSGQQTAGRGRFMVSAHLHDIYRSIADVEAGAPPLVELPLSGLSGRKIIALLQRLAVEHARGEEVCYLEIGVFRGLTLLSVAKAMPDGRAYGIDNFSQFDPRSENLGLVRAHMRKLEIDNASILDMDYEDALERLDELTGGRKIGVYFVDGPHDYRSQLMCLLLARPFLSDQAVIVVDDANYRHVRQAHRDVLSTHPELKLLFEAYTPRHPRNMTPKRETEARAGWWNGVHVLVRDAGNELAAVMPPTERDRTLFENEHLVHGMRCARYAPEALRIAAALRRLNPLTVLGHNLRLLWKVRRVARVEPELSLNTFSHDLPAVRYNPTLAGAEAQTPVLAEEPS